MLTIQHLYSSNPKIPRALDIDLFHTFEHKSVVCCVGFSIDGKLLATGSNKLAQIFEVQTGSKIMQVLRDAIIPHFAYSTNTFLYRTLADEEAPKDADLYIRSVAFSPDGKYLATGAEDNLIRLWSIAKKKVVRVFSGHEQDIYSLDFSADGRMLASGSGDRTARLWDMEQGKCLLSLKIDDTLATDAGITSVNLSPNGRFIAAASLDRTVRIWDVKSGNIVEKFDGHSDSVYSVAFTPEGKHIISGSLDGTVRVWQLGVRAANPKSTGCTMSLTGHKDFVLSVACAPTGTWAISGSKDRTVQFWDLRKGIPLMMLQGHKNSGKKRGRREYARGKCAWLIWNCFLVISVAVSPHERYIATGSGDCRARIWKYESIE